MSSTTETEKAVSPAKALINRAHFIQSILAGGYILLVFWFMHYLHDELAVASLGASAFIAFTYPFRQMSRPRVFIGGYCIGAFCGLACSGIAFILQNYLSIPSYIPACALALLISMFLMNLFNLRHPSAAALAVAITINPQPIILSLAGLACVIILCVVKELCKKFLYDLESGDHHPC